MATLTVLKLPSPDGAQTLLNIVYGLQNQEVITLLDAATVSWPAIKQSPRTKQAVNLTGSGTFNDSFWGMLFGMIFFIPFFGPEVGTAIEVLSGNFAEYGINDAFIKDVRAKVTRGTSALFLLTEGDMIDKLVAEFNGVDFELITLNLSREQENLLRSSFG
jgi:uncharacterized membrane protein